VAHEYDLHVYASSTTDLHRQDVPGPTRAHGLSPQAETPTPHPTPRVAQASYKTTILQPEPHPSHTRLNALPRAWCRRSPRAQCLRSAAHCDVQRGLARSLLQSARTRRGEGGLPSLNPGNVGSAILRIQRNSRILYVWLGWLPHLPGVRRFIFARDQFEGTSTRGSSLTIPKFKLQIYRKRDK
jgi:hypothetical protein